MKTKLFLSVLLSLNFCLLSSQVPQGFNYQAIARDGSGNPITGATIKVKLSVLSDTTGFYSSGSGAYIWEEEHLNVKTNSFGLFTVVFGDLSATKTLGTADSFSAINWSQSPLFIGTKIANPSTYKNLGSAKLWSVPYSMVTARADSTKGLLTGSKLSVVSSNDLDTNALFAVKRKDGQTVFAVYPDAVNVYLPPTGKGATKGGFAIGSFGNSKAPSQNYLLVKPDTVRIFIDDTPGKASKGGFAIGGFGTSKTPSQHLFEVTPDSIRAYIDTNTKGIKGGFAIGGFGAGKAPGEQYLRVTRDSTRVYVNESGKGVKGGFAIGGFSNDKGTSVIPFTSLTPDNNFLGQKSGINNTTGLYNSFFESEAGINNTTGSQNVFLGYQAGYTNNDGLNNVFIGNKAGYLNTLGFQNICIGTEAGYSITGTGQENICIGTASGYNVTTGYYNCFYGNSAGYSNKEGYNNVYIGEESGDYDTTGVNNVILGAFAGWKGLSFSHSIFIGANAGKYSSGSSNIFIGENSGMGNISLQETGSGYNTAVGISSGENIQTGQSNVFIGYNSGNRIASGSNNVFLGCNAGCLNDANNNIFIGNQAGFFETGSNKLYIANSTTATPLIGGDFSGPCVGINRMPTNLATLEVGGTIWANGSVIVAGSTTWSDARYKTNVVPLTDALNDILRIQGVKFDWKKSEFPQLNFPEGEQIGVIAQDLEKILPQLVYTAHDGYKSVSYEKLTPVLVEAVKEQQKQILSQQFQIESQNQENQKLKSQIQSIQGKVDQIESQQKEIDELKTIVNTLVANQTGQGNK